MAARTTFKLNRLTAAIAALCASSVLLAQAPDAAKPAPQNADDTVQLDEIKVTGVRATQRTSAQEKRDASVILDALVNDEVGASPDLSVGETLERIVGVSADRFKGSASEISLRGMGPFLGFSTFNGREVSSGSGDRAVSFQQFPSDIVNGIVVYKSQRPDLLEGGVSGVIDLRTVRPLDFGKSRAQVDVRASYNDYANRVDGDSGLGGRAAASGISQWDTKIGRVGLAVGLSRIDATAPEDFYTASSSFRPCNSINTTPLALSGGTAGSNCTQTNTLSNPTYFVGNTYNWRQLTTLDERDAMITAVQWQPSEAWDINIDWQASQRESVEDRHDLSLAEGRRGIRPVLLSDEGALLRWQGNSVLESINTIRDRDETYVGGGINIDWQATERLKWNADLSFSRTNRDQLDLSTRLRSGTALGAGGRVAYTVDQRGTVPTIEFATPVNLNDHRLFNSAAFARRQAETRTDDIRALRLDGLYTTGLSWLTDVGFGVRYSEHSRITDLDNNNNVETVSAALTAAGQAACQIPFPQRNWGASSSANFSSWAAFDTRCLYQNFTGSADLGPLADPRSASDIDVSEDIAAAYLSGNFAGAVGAVPYTGVFGLRYVRTGVRSTGFRGDFRVVPSGGNVVLQPIPGSFVPVVIENDFGTLLPSVNINFELTPTLNLRGALYRAMARPNIEAMGAGRTFVLDAQGVDIADAIAGVSGGNPRLEPLLADSIDLSLEWYANADTLVSGALFYKELKAGIVPAGDASLTETFVIGNQTFTVPVAQERNSDQTRNLSGVELTVQHSLSYLPGAWAGLGFQLGYTYVDSNFAYVDPSAIDPANPLRNFTDPVNIPGLSEHSGSATVYWENDDWTLRALYKYRSSYFKPFELTANREVVGAGFLDLSTDYQLVEHVQLRFQALNVLNQAQTMMRPVDGSRAETGHFGRTLFMGVRLRW
jgi:iron complex outermembrane recepter protein